MRLPVLLCLIVVSSFALAAEKPLMPLRKGMAIDMSRLVTPKDATGGKWALKGNILTVDAREEPSAVSMPFPVLPTGGYDFYIGISAEDENQEMQIDFPVAKQMLTLKFTPRGMIFGNTRYSEFKAKKGHMFTITMQVKGGKKPRLVMHMDEYQWTWEVEEGDGTPIDSSSRMKLSAKGSRCAFQNFKVRVMD